MLLSFFLHLYDVKWLHKPLHCYIWLAAAHRGIQACQGMHSSFLHLYDVMWLHQLLHCYIWLAAAHGGIQARQGMQLLTQQRLREGCALNSTTQLSLQSGKRCESCSAALTAYMGQHELHLH